MSRCLPPYNKAMKQCHGDGSSLRSIWNVKPCFASLEQPSKNLVHLWQCVSIPSPLHPLFGKCIKELIAKSIFELLLCKIYIISWWQTLQSLIHNYSIDDSPYHKAIYYFISNSYQSATIILQSIQPYVLPSIPCPLDRFYYQEKHDCLIYQSQSTLLVSLSLFSLQLSLLVCFWI